MIRKALVRWMRGESKYNDFIPKWKCGLCYSRFDVPEMGFGVGIVDGLGYTHRAYKCCPRCESDDVYIPNTTFRRIR